MKQRLSTPGLWLLAAVALVACGDADGGGVPVEPPDPTETKNVSLVDNQFVPRANKVAAGETVTWTWNGNNPHNVTFDDGPPHSSTLNTGIFNRTFDDPGTFTYWCTIHGRSVMSGAVTVE